MKNNAILQLQTRRQTTMLQALRQSMLDWFTLCTYVTWNKSLIRLWCDVNANKSLIIDQGKWPATHMVWRWRCAWAYY